MDFDFYDKKLKPVGTVSVGAELMKKIMSTTTIPKLETNGELPPDSSLDKDELSDLITLSTIEKDFIGKELSELLSGEFYKEIEDKKRNSISDYGETIQEKISDDSNNTHKSNAQVVVELLSYLVNDNITHFRLG
ncbi:hypothetical protein [Geminocystis herdmanii]|uniref:hypothetical protein n=1 Tax=Geminocystis herdmanii TaxID=669359 RepID=UPI00034D137F|nr:hypothetical protein [Geminocystis herdmanii]